MQRINRRSDDMLIIRGVNLYPSQIEEAVFSAAQGKAPYQIVIERIGATDTMEVIVEVTDKIFTLELQKQRSFLESVKKRINTITGINASVKVVEANSIPRQAGEIIKVLDKRRS
jgi:phenylacetate-CoA ligase